MKIQAMRKLKKVANICVASLVALVAGAAWAEGNWWPANTESGEWGTVWSGADETGDYNISIWNNVAVTFANAYTISKALNIHENSVDNDYVVTFTGNEDAKGLTMAGLNIGGTDGKGNLSLGAGSWISTAYTYVGADNAGNFTLTDGTYTQNGDIFVVGHGSAAGSATISGGTLNLNSGYRDTGIIDDKVSLYIGENSGTGTMTISGGNVKITEKSLVGIRSKGTLNILGGTLTASKEIRVGGTGDGDNTLRGEGVMNVSSGTVYANGGLTIGRGGNATLTISGDGEVIVPVGNGRTFWMGANSSSDTYGKINLNGGVLAIPHRCTWSAGNQINFNGGTLKAQESHAEFLTDQVSITVNANGGTIDTNGKAITISSAVTGTGALRIIGGGVVTFTTAPTCGLNVENGVAVLPKNSAVGAITIGAHGVLAFDLTGETITSGNDYTLATVTSLTIPSGESYADSIFTIGPDFTSTITLEGTTLKAKATSAATDGITRNITTCVTDGAYIDAAGGAGWSNGSPNAGNADAGLTTRRDIIVIPNSLSVNVWQTHHPARCTYVVRGATFTLNGANGTSNVVAARIVNTGTFVLSASDNCSISLTVEGVSSMGCVQVSSNTLSFPADSTYTLGKGTKVSSTDNGTITLAPGWNKTDVTVVDPATGNTTVVSALDRTGANAVDGSWAVYANGGADAQTTVNNRTAYAAVVDVVDGVSGATIAGIVADMTETKAYSSINTFTVVDNRSAKFVVGGAKIATKNGKDYKLTHTGDTFVQLQGATTTEYAYGSSYYATINSTVVGNSGVVIANGAKITGSVIGGLAVYDFYNSNTSHPKFTGNSAVLIQSLQDDNSGATLGGDCPSGWRRNYNKYLVVGGSVVLGMHNYSSVDIEGDTSVKIELSDGTSGVFGKTIVGSNASLINNSNQNSPSHVGNSSVSITAPNTVTFTQPIYGGGFAIRSSAPVTGNTSVIINGGTYSSTIYAGTCVGAVSGTAVLTIKSGVFTGSLRGYNTDGDNAQSTVTEGATLAIEGDVDLSSCSIANFGTITIAKGKTVTISSSQVSMFTAQGLSVEENDGVYTAKYVPKYFWTGTGGNKNWSNPDNWIVGDTYETATATESVPTAIDPVTISVADSIVIDTADCAAQQITVDAAVTFTGNKLAVCGVTGMGAITLGDGAGFSVDSNVTIANNIAVTASESSPAVLSATSGVGITLGGTLLESTGYLKFDGSGSRHYLSVVNQFKGTIEVDVGTTIGDFMSTASASPNVRWVITSYTGRNTKSQHSNFVKQGAVGDEVTCEFGELSGTLQDENAASHGCVIFTVGALCGSDDTMALTYRGTNNTDRDSAFKMVGEGTFAIDATYVRRYECDSGIIELKTANSLPRAGGTVQFNGGTLKLNSAITTSTDPSEKFVLKNDTTAILDDGGVTREFASAIGNETSANFTKKGAGTLTLSQAPTYTGATTVEEGVLYVPAGTTLKLGNDTHKVPSNKAGYDKYIHTTASGFMFMAF